MQGTVSPDCFTHRVSSLGGCFSGASDEADWVFLFAGRVRESRFLLSVFKKEESFAAAIEFSSEG
jgi:hypothetical protein